MAIFGKKPEVDTKGSDTKVDDLPEELPSLAEEIVEKADTGQMRSRGAAASSGKAAAENSPDDDSIPDELPDIEPESMQVGAPGGGGPGPERAAGSGTRPAIIQDSFFKDIEQRLNEAKNSTQVLREMRQYWLEKIDHQNIDMPSLVEVEKRLKAKVAALSSLEQDWVSNRKELDKLKIMISNNEAEIELRTKELQALKTEKELIRQVQEEKRSQMVDHHKVFKHIAGSRKHHFTVDKAFVLWDGKRIYSPRELANKVALMDMSEFRHYTHPQNHFSTWIKDVFHDDHLANEVARAENPMQLAAVLTKHL